MSKNNKTIDESAQNLESNMRIEAIKNLIFGENIQQIDQDFSEVKSLIEQRKEELENYILEVKTELHKTIDNLSTDLNIRITDLESQFNDKTNEINHKKVDRHLLGSFFISMGEKIMKDY